MKEQGLITYQGNEMNVVSRKAMLDLLASCRMTDEQSEE